MAGAFLAVRRHGEALAASQAGPEELEAVGRAMAGLSAPRALEAFSEWTKKQGFIGRLTNKGSELRRVAIGGIGLGDLAPGAIRQLTSSEVARLRKAAEKGASKGPGRRPSNRRN